MPEQAEHFGFEISFWIAPSNRDEFLQTAASLARLSDDRPACSQGCFEQAGADGWFLWKEFCESRLSLERRLRSPTLRTLFGAIDVLGKLSKLRQVEVTLVDEKGRKLKMGDQGGRDVATAKDANNLKWKGRSQ